MRKIRNKNHYEFIQLQEFINQYVLSLHNNVCPDFATRGLAG